MFLGNINSDCSAFIWNLEGSTEGVMFVINFQWGVYLGSKLSEIRLRWFGTFNLSVNFTELECYFALMSGIQCSLVKIHLFQLSV